MKKILSLGLILVLLSAAASAQVRPRDRFRGYRIQRNFNSGLLTRPERFELRKDAFRYQMLERKTRRDGIVTPFERRRLHRARRNTRVDLFRFRHNGRRRII